MERPWVVLALFALIVAMVPAANARGASDAAFCFGCTTETQFALAAMEGFGVGLTGTRQAVVGNPNTGDFRQMTLTQTAAGKVNVSVASQLTPREAAAKLGDGVQAKVFVAGCDGVVQLPTATSRVADGKNHAVERGTLVRLGVDVYGLVLCQSPLLASYSSANMRALSRALQLAALRLGLDRKGAVKVYGQATASVGTSRQAAPMPKPHKVCAIFNNGDSACYRMAGAPPGSDEQGAGGASGVAIVNRGSRVEYGAPGSTGQAGETWLVCDETGGQVSDCHTTTR